MPLRPVHVLCSLFMAVGCSASTTQPKAPETPPLAVLVGATTPAAPLSSASAPLPGLTAPPESPRPTPRRQPSNRCRTDVPADLTSFDAARPQKSNVFEMPDTSGWLAPDVIEQTVQSRFDTFLTCYERGREHNEELGGKLVTRFIIEQDGSVRRAKLDCLTLQDDRVARCILAAYREMHFPKPEKGAVTVVYPLNLRPSN